MSNKITDARIEELARLQNLKNELQEKLRKEREGMQAILDSMSPETQELVSSSSKATKDVRGKESSNLRHQDLLDACMITIDRLEEDFSNVEKELEGLQDLMKAP